MKRTVIVAAGVVALLGVAVYVGRLWAQTTPPRPAAAAEPRTRVALLNLPYVMKNYDKFRAFQEELKVAVKPYQDHDAQWKKEGETLAKDVQDPKTDAATRELKERTLKDLQRKLEDNKNDANKVLVKKQEEQLKILYMDVRSTAERYALAHNFEMVLHYNDAPAEPEFSSAQNIARKMQAPLFPIYSTKGMDISAEVVTTLNQAYRATAAPRPPAAGGTGAPAAGTRR